MCVFHFFHALFFECIVAGRWPALYKYGHDIGCSHLSSLNINGLRRALHTRIAENKKVKKKNKIGREGVRIIEGVKKIKEGRKEENWKR